MTIFFASKENANNINRKNVTKNKMVENIFKNYEWRTIENYADHVAALSTSRTSNQCGVKFKCVFNSLKSFHVCNPGLPHCLAHDLFEGLVTYDIPIIINKLV